MFESLTKDFIIKISEVVPHTDSVTICSPRQRFLKLQKSAFFAFLKLKFTNLDLFHSIIAH